MRNKTFIKTLLALVLGGFVFSLSACAPQSEEDRTAQEAGGTIPWNRPEKWEGGGALGSQMSQFSH